MTSETARHDTCRLDQALVARGLVATRSRARDLVLRGKVSVDGRTVVKPAEMVDGAVQIALSAEHVSYVSRGAEKLIGALNAFSFDPAGRIALDIGASTGGFTEVLLKRDAARVYAVDVGRDQLHPTLRENPRVISLESRDSRTLDRELVPEPVTVIVADVSFISLTKALPAALDLAVSGCWLAALVKPQFEAGREAIGKGGLVSDPAIHARVLDDMVTWIGTRPGWTVSGTCPSPIAGGDGNQEFLIGAVRS